MSIERRFAQWQDRYGAPRGTTIIGGPLEIQPQRCGHPIGGDTGRQPCDCRRQRHELLPQAGDESVRWARCLGCGALSRWSPSPVPSWIEIHAIEVAVVGLAGVIVAICLMMGVVG
jgi:hypothetical protein